MTAQVLCEGYLTKSPPEHKINRARWCKRYFQLCNFEGEILLQYFKDSSCTKLKGTINLRECEQVDQGLSFETKSKLKDAFIFDIVTQRRKYFLVTESEDEMLHWVRSICTACGFQSEDSISTISDQTEGPGSPSRFAETPLNAGSPPTTAITQPPLTNGNESYIDIADCETGNPLASSNGLPPKLNAKEMFPQQVPQARQPRGYDTMSSTSSSAPSDSAPSPPNSRPTSQIDGGIDADIYDVPPVRTSDDAPPVPVRPLTATEESVYKVVPASKDPTSFKFDRQISSASSNRGSFSNSDDLGSSQTYDLVPSFNDRRSSGFESVESSGPQSSYETPPPRPPPPPVTEDIYQVPPSRQSLEAEMDTLYDIPPTSPQIDSTYDILPSPMQKTPKQNIPSHLKTSEQISKSTDDLARSFEEISQQNANQSFTNGDLEHSTYDPVPAMDLNASIGSNSSFGSVFKDLGPSSTAMEAPPRPAKPHGMCPSTPPSSIDETYVAPVQPNHRFSPKEIRRRLTSIEMNNPPSMVNHQHMWMDQVIQPPKYINTKRAGTSHALARPNSSFNPKGYIPMRSNTVSSGSRATFPAMGYQNGQPGSANGQHPPGSYMAMQGSSESPKGGLGAPITEESYMHMQSQNDGNPEMYTLMNSNAPAVPRRPPRQSTSSMISISSTGSGDSLPPPIDRRNKPRSTDSAILIPEMVGMEGSFYATGPELPPDFPVQNPRTKSFSKRPTRHREASGVPSTPPRPHRSTLSSSSSHAEHDSYSITPSVDDSYVFSDPAPPKPRIETRHSSIDSAIHAHPSPTLPPRSHTVEYLELDHDSDSPSTLPRLPKPTSPKDQVEYIHLDPEKTKALQDVMQNREECYRPKNNDGGTLKK